MTRSASSQARAEYLEQQTRRFWAYREQVFRARDSLFESALRGTTVPPVFVHEHHDENVLVRPDAPDGEARNVRGLIRPSARHRHFGSMRSSQALAQTVFGNLIVLGRLDALSSVLADDGRPAFVADLASATSALEKSVSGLGEPSPTSVDFWLEGPSSSRVAVEVKLSEAEAGVCSRPRVHQHPHPCDGTYRVQHQRQHRCALAAEGIRYWEHVPSVLDWDVDVDHDPCPLQATYQLVRNVLAACVVDGKIDTRHHALLIYDARNPCWGIQGAGDRAFSAVKAALREPAMLRRCSWQRLVSHLERGGGCQ